MAEIVPFVTPEGYVKIAGSRRFDVVDAVPYEKWDTETVVAKQHADQAAKPQKVKDREKTAKDLIIGLGFSVPVPQDELDTMLPALLAQVQTLLANNKTKEAVAIMANVQALMALWSVLGEDIHAPFLGEGGNPE